MASPLVRGASHYPQLVSFRLSNAWPPSQLSPTSRSLHATTEDLRDRLVPVNRKYRLAELIAVCRRFPTKRREHITFEYVLLRDVNDSVTDAKRLVKLLTGIRAKINIIPLNEAAGIPYRRPSDHQINQFASTLAKSDLIFSRPKESRS
ncbi:MAG: hypothetical protein Ct9H300mP25_11630 [Acidobacteriota bacterium]|nr:MAG: hypothetical protein Ct9H300mP25_11630 [Acidobacteriota bacterium]